MENRSNGVAKFVDTVREGKDGFSFGDPWRVDTNSTVCIIPIIRTLNGEPDYVVAARAGDDLVIEDTGHIGTARVTNKGKKPVFLRMGEILSGSTQERIIAFSRIIRPGKTEEVEILCIHASRPISRGAKFKTHGFAPGKEAFNASSMFRAGRVSQHESWEGDSKFVGELKQACCILREDLGEAMSVGDDDLTAAHDIAAKGVEEILKKLPLLNGQVGMGLIDHAGVSFLEAFNLSVPWKDIRDAIVKKEGLSIVSGNLSGVFEYRPEKAHEIIRGLLLYPFEERVVFNGEGTETVVLDYEGYSGEAIVLEGKVIHLVIARKEQGKPHYSRAS